MLVAAYVMAAFLPQFGLALREVNFGKIKWMGESEITLNLSLIMISFVLFNAGLGTKVQELKSLLKRPVVFASGFIANAVVPVFLVFLFLKLMQYWHDPDEVQNLLVGLAVITAMPIAGSSTAWAQNANGNLSLSLGLVLLSTFLSPVITPFVLTVFERLAHGQYSGDLHGLALHGTQAFLMVAVVLPSLSGVLVRLLIGEAKILAVRPVIKLSNFLLLLLLNYSNAATTLPQALGNPDPDFFLLIYGLTFVLCASAFGAGWLISLLLKVDRSDRASLMFGLGMNNNGTGLVLAASALANHPSVLLPIISYTLVQQALAAIIDWRMFKDE
jgi:bile acid:Na+ symporter, BASS family